MSTEQANGAHNIQCRCGWSYHSETWEIVAQNYQEHVKTCQWHLECVPKPVNKIEPLLIGESKTIECLFEPAGNGITYITIREPHADNQHYFRLEDAERLIIWLGEVLERHGE